MDGLRYKKYINLREMIPGIEGTVVDINAGPVLKRKLYSMNIRPGKKIKKISDFWGTPIVIKVDDCVYALGRGITNKIIVGYNEIDEEP